MVAIVTVTRSESTGGTDDGQIGDTVEQGQTDGSTGKMDDLSSVQRTHKER